jgi:hypothetical protein
MGAYNGHMVSDEIAWNLFNVGYQSKTAVNDFSYIFNKRVYCAQSHTCTICTLIMQQEIKTYGTVLVYTYKKCIIACLEVIFVDIKKYFTFEWKMWQCGQNKQRHEL